MYVINQFHREKTILEIAFFVKYARDHNEVHIYVVVMLSQFSFNFKLNIYN